VELASDISSPSLTSEQEHLDALHQPFMNCLCNITATQDDYAKDTQVFGMVSNNTSKYSSNEKESRQKSKKSDHGVKFGYDVIER